MAEQVFLDALATYSAVGQHPDIQYYKDMLHLFLNEKLPLVAEGEIIVTTDPLEEADDLCMLRYGVYNTHGHVTVIMSAGVHTPAERLAHLIDLFECFKGAEFDVPFKTPNGSILFVADGCRIPYPAKVFINCGPCSSITLESITFTEQAKLITVGANDDGTLGPGTNQKQTDEAGKLITIPLVWNSFIQRAKDQGVLVKNMSVDLTRYVLFPNPAKGSPQSPFYEMAHPKIMEYIKAATGMFVVSRPPPEYGKRVNEGNSIVDIQLCSTFTKNKDYYRGLEKLNEYIKLSESKQLPSVHYQSAAIPLMVAHAIGAEYLPGMFGFSPTDKQAKLTLSCLTRESAAKVFAAIEKLDYVTPAYDPLAYMEAFL
jgi:hypothetical protein